MFGCKHWRKTTVRTIKALICLRLRVCVECFSLHHGNRLLNISSRGGGVKVCVSTVDRAWHQSVSRFQRIYTSVRGVRLEPQPSQMKAELQQKPEVEKVNRLGVRLGRRERGRGEDGFCV